MVDTVSRNDSYCKLWKVVKMLLVLSDGQATLERGFSINKQVETYNVTEESLVANITICDYVSYMSEGFNMLHYITLELFSVA